MSDQEAPQAEQITVFMLEEGDFGVALSPDLPNTLLLVVPKAGQALGFSLDKVAQSLHDQICELLSLSMLEELTEEEETEPLPEQIKLFN
jgi:hypothetical protein